MDAPNKNFPKLVLVFTPNKNFIHKLRRCLLHLAPDSQCSRTGFEMFRSALPANAYFREEAATTIARQNDLI